MDSEKQRSVPASPEDEFAEMERKLKEAQEKLARFQQKKTGNRETGPAAAPEKPEEPDEDAFRQLCDKLPEDQFPLGYARDGEPLALPMDGWQRLGVYTGRKTSARKILGNLLTAAKHTGMQVFVLRKKMFTEFDTGVLFQYAGLKPDDASYWNGDASGMEILTRVLHREIVNQNVFRDEYCEKNGIPADDPQRSAKASGYIREHTRPLLILFESVGDLTRADAPEDVTDALELYLTRSCAYNIHFIGVFSPDDGEAIWNHPLARAFADADEALLIGEAGSGQRLADLPAGEAPEADKDDFILRRGAECVRGAMPRGSLRTDLDEFSKALMDLMRATEEYEEPADDPPADGPDV